MKDKLERIPNRNRVGNLTALFTLVLILFADQVTYAQKNKELRVIFYNTENLFDTLDSQLDDNEFLPGSERNWNSYRYNKKLTNISKTIVATGGWESPDIVALCEIENILVLNDLVSKTILRKVNYNTLYAGSADRRGIGIGLIYKKKYKLVSSRVFYPLMPDGDTLATRSVLLATMETEGDTMDIIVSHWPSRRGGVSLTDPLREILALLIKEIIESEIQKDKERKIIVLGDFNCNPDSYILSDILEVKKPDDIPSKTMYLISPQAAKPNSETGSYKFQGRWNNFDQLIINSNLANAEYGLRYKSSSFRIFANDNILTEDRSYRGLKPLSTWSGPIYIGGFSDHLPIVFDLEIIN